MICPKQDLSSSLDCTALFARLGFIPHVPLQLFLSLSKVAWHLLALTPKQYQAIQLSRGSSWLTFTTREFQQEVTREIGQVSVYITHLSFRECFCILWMDCCSVFACRLTSVGYYCDLKHTTWKIKSEDVTKLKQLNTIKTTLVWAHYSPTRICKRIAAAYNAGIANPTSNLLTSKESNNSFNSTARILNALLCVKHLTLARVFEWP